MTEPTIYRITHLWPNKQPGHGSTTAEMGQDRWTMMRCRDCGMLSEALDEPAKDDKCPFCGSHSALEIPVHERVEVVPAPSSTVQIKPETDELNALPSRFVSLQDYERLERAGHRVLILDDAEPGEVSEAHVAVIGELRAALSSEATKGESDG